MKKKKFKKGSNQNNFSKLSIFQNQKFKFKGKYNFKKLLIWSIKKPNLFWSAVWDFSKVKGIKSTKYKKTKKFIDNKFLLNSKLNLSFLFLILAHFLHI